MPESAHTAMDYYEHMLEAAEQLAYVQIPADEDGDPEAVSDRDELRDRIYETLLAASLPFVPR